MTLHLHRLSRMLGLEGVGVATIALAGCLNPLGMDLEPASSPAPVLAAMAYREPAVETPGTGSLAIAVEVRDGATRSLVPTLR